MGYFILCLADTLRRHGACFVDSKAALASIEALELASPALVKAARLHLSDERVTRVLRGLAAEQISVRNLRQILEALLEFDVDARSGDVLEFVRASLQHQIADQVTRGTGSL